MSDPLRKSYSTWSEDSVQILWWFISLLTLSLYFKYSYLSYLYHEGLFAVAGGETTLTSRVLFLLLLAGRDVLEVALLVATSYFALHRLARIRLTPVIIGVTLILGLVGMANLMSFQQLQNFVTIQNVQISVSWFLADSSLLARYFSLENALLGGIGAAWIAVSALLPRLISAIERGASRQLRFVSALTGFAAYLLCAGLFLVFYGLPYNPTWWAVLAVGAIASLGFLPLLTGVVNLRPMLQPMCSWTLPLLGVFIAATSVLYWLISPRYLTEQHPINAGHWSEITKSLAGAGSANPLYIEVPEKHTLMSEYARLAFPAGNGSGKPELLVLPAEKRIPRHIVVVSLETAASHYYPILNNPAFPNFQELGRNALISEQHHTNIPFTTQAAYSMLSGLYAWPAINFSNYGELWPDSLPTILRQHGYESTYIDAFLINWQAGQRHEQLLMSLGFDAAIDESGTDDIRNKLSYDDKLQREANAFRKATEKVAEAEARDKKAFVFVQSQLGHYSWAAKPGHENDPPTERIRNITSDLDELFGLLLSSLDASGLRDDVIIVVTGDHGLRFSYEFQTLGREMSHSDLEFNVPLFVYSPGLLDEAVALPYITSHVDIAPTLLSLVGIPGDSFMHHGMSMLDQRIADRATFLMNTGLTPVDGFHWHGNFLTYNKLTGEVLVATHMNRSDRTAFRGRESTLPAALHDVPEVIERANENFRMSNIFFLKAHDK